jgi:hypothetical protein
MVNFEAAKPRFCVDCKYHVLFCNSCKAPQLGYNLVTGEQVHGSCREQRDSPYSGNCGTGARWFRPKEVK